jgi:murein DD-endopeptidase
MKIRWENVWELERKQFEGMGEAEKFVYWLLLQYRSPYCRGKETPEGSDCSGAICMALFAATGLLVRTTADDLYKRVFNIRGAKSGIRAAFFITEDDRKRDGVLIKKGTAVHVAGLLDEGVVLNSASPGARVRALSDIKEWFAGDWCRCEVRGLDRAALERLIRENMREGIDSELWAYFVE